MNAGTPPVWLNEDAEICALLHAVVNRFDRQPGDARQRHVSLPAEKHLPTLARTDAQADQSWAFVHELEHLGVLSIRSVRRNPLDPEWKGAKLAFAPASEPVLREWLRREWIEPAIQLWRRAVQSRAEVFKAGCEPLLTRRIDIPGRSADQVVAAFAGIASIKGPITLRQLSAGAFWGDSKILDDRADLIAALFPGLQVLERTLVVSVFLPENCNGVLFIENQDTYTTAACGLPTACREFALVYAAGFRSAAARVRNRAGTLMHYAGPGVPTEQARFERWWYDSGPALGPCWFWGDLDFAGMQILKSLRSRFEALGGWRPGYDPMLDALRSRGGYDPSTTGVDPGQLDPNLTGCPYADATLLPAIREHGQTDQESITRRAER
jgi:Uncharacterized protein conserved in bacteria C-term(DUF2220)